MPSNAVFVMSAQTAYVCGPMLRGEFGWGETSTDFKPADLIKMFCPKLKSKSAAGDDKSEALSQVDWKTEYAESQFGPFLDYFRRLCTEFQSLRQRDITCKMKQFLTALKAFEPIAKTATAKVRSTDARDRTALTTIHSGFLKITDVLCRTAAQTTNQFLCKTANAIRTAAQTHALADSPNHASQADAITAAKQAQSAFVAYCEAKRNPIVCSSHLI